MEHKAMYTYENMLDAYSQAASDFSDGYPPDFKFIKEYLDSFLDSLFIVLYNGENIFSTFVEEDAKKVFLKESEKLISGDEIKILKGKNIILKEWKDVQAKQQD